MRLKATAPRIWWTATATTVVVSLLIAGEPISQINSRGSGRIVEFFSASIRPELSPEFLALIGRETSVTVSYAILGTVAALVIGTIGGLLSAEIFWCPLGKPNSKRGTRRGPKQSRARRLIARSLSIPRAIHEVIWGLLLLQIFGLDPIVAVLAIAIPFGAITAKVFAEHIDGAPTGPTKMLRTQGANRLASVLYGSAALAKPDLVSYSFYRFECALRSAAVLGIVGAGGLGFQLALSFTSLRYSEMWTSLWALIALSAIAAKWSDSVRLAKQTATRFALPNRKLFSILAVFGATAAAWWWTGLKLNSLADDRVKERATRLAGELWPPKLDAETLSELGQASVDTLAISVLAIVIAAVVAAVLAALSSRPHRLSSANLTQRTILNQALSTTIRFALLVARAMPPPVGAFLALLVFFAGPWPGIAALAVYNIGVLGRLQTETTENSNQQPALALRAQGANSLQVWLYVTWPTVRRQFGALTLYRWETIIRDSVVVGVVGAGGLGRIVDQATTSFDEATLASAIIAYVIIVAGVDATSDRLRHVLA